MICMAQWISVIVTGLLPCSLLVYLRIQITVTLIDCLLSYYRTSTVHISRWKVTVIAADEVNDRKLHIRPDRERIQLKKTPSRQKLFLPFDSRCEPQRRKRLMSFQLLPNLDSSPRFCQKMNFIVDIVTWNLQVFWSRAWSDPQDVTFFIKYRKIDFESGDLITGLYCTIMMTNSHLVEVSEDVVYLLAVHHAVLGRQPAVVDGRHRRGWFLVGHGTNANTTVGPYTYDVYSLHSPEGGPKK